MLLQNISHFCSCLPLDFLSFSHRFPTLSIMINHLWGGLSVIFRLSLSSLTASVIKRTKFLEEFVCCGHYTSTLPCTCSALCFYKLLQEHISSKIWKSGVWLILYCDKKRDFVLLYLVQCCRFLFQNTFTAFSDSPPGKAVSSCCEMGV